MGFKTSDEGREAYRVASQAGRDAAGVTVTFAHGDAREVAVFDAEPIFAAIRAACVYCRWLGPDWRVLAISTPSTVYRDLIGRTGGAPETRFLAHAGESREILHASLLP